MTIGVRRREECWDNVRATRRRLSWASVIAGKAFWQRRCALCRELSTGVSVEFTIPRKTGPVRIKVRGHRDLVMGKNNKQIVQFRAQQGSRYADPRCPHRRIIMHDGDFGLCLSAKLSVKFISSTTQNSLLCRPRRAKHDEAFARRNSRHC